MHVSEVDTAMMASRSSSVTGTSYDREPTGGCPGDLAVNYVPHMSTLSGTSGTGDSSLPTKGRLA